jgi:hypothetical protein|tara:strand:+ start:1421 stop:3346 length:1926 start_codon:yes stop_codon:yes gene_type:complete
MVILYSLSCLGIGQLAMLAIRAGHRETTMDFTFVFAVATFILGQAVLAAIWIPIGLTGQFNVFVVTVVILIGITPVIIGYKQYSNLLISKLVSGWQWLIHTDIAFRTICFGLLGLLLLFFLSALLTGPLGDAEAYYMAYSKVMATSGHLVKMPGLYEPFSQIGIMGELHMAALMTLGIDAISKLIVWPIAISTGLMLVAICGQVGIGKKGQWIAFIMLFTSTGFTDQIWDGKVDVFPVALGLAAIYWIMLEDRVSKTSLRLIGLFSGFAMVAKFSYIPILLPSFFILIAWRLYVSTEGQHNTRKYIVKMAMDSFTLSLWVFLAWGPHLLKNWLLFEAPLAPFVGLNASLSQPWFSAEGTAWILKTYPLTLVFGRYPGQGGNLSFLWLAFLPLILFLPKAKSFVRSPLTQITTTGIIGVGIWMLLRPSWIAPRYIFISLALLIPMVAWAAEQIYEKEERPYFLRIAILITILFAVLFVSYPHIKNTGLKAIRNSDIQDECALSGEYCGSFNTLNSIAHLGARMYFAGYYGYWARADMLQCQLSLAEMQFLDNIKDKNDKWKYLLERGVSYVVIDRSSHAQKALEFGSTPTPSWLSRELIVDDQKLMVWKIQSSDAKRLAKVECNANETKSWKLYEKNEEVSD